MKNLSLFAIVTLLAVACGNSWFHPNSPSGPTFSNVYSLQLNGTNQDANMGTGASINPDLHSTSMSLGGWVYLNNGSAVFAGNIDTPANGYKGFVFAGGPLTGANDLEFYANNSYSGNSVAVRTDAGAYTTGAWHHIGVTMSGPSAAQVKFYVDGANVAVGHTYFDSLTGSTVSSQRLELGGGDNNGPSFTGAGWLNGYMTQWFMIVGTALNASDWSSIYNAGHPQTLASFSPTSWWQFQNNFTDSGSAGNNGSGVNSPTFTTFVP